MVRIQASLLCLFAGIFPVASVKFIDGMPLPPVVAFLLVAFGFAVFGALPGLLRSLVDAVSAVVEVTAVKTDLIVGALVLRVERKPGRGQRALGELHRCDLEVVQIVVDQPVVCLNQQGVPAFLELKREILLVFGIVIPACG